MVKITAMPPEIPQLAKKLGATLHKNKLTKLLW